MVRQKNLDNMVENNCDGMPTMYGCSERLYTSRKITVPGMKKSGWFAVWAEGDDGKPDKSYLCLFCPSCAIVVKRQIKERENGNN